MPVTLPTVTDDSGPKTDGTLWNAAFVAAEQAAINAAINSVANPTVDPKTTTDEVITARGSKASLDARLDVALNEDGTLKAGVGSALVTEVQSILASRNLVVNGDLADWSNGGALAPDEWTLTGAGATIARTGPGQADTTSFDTGEEGFAAKITRAGADCSLGQDVIPTGNFAGSEDGVESRKVTAGAWLRTSVSGSHLRLAITDGVSTTYSTYHSGSGLAEYRSVLHTISESATKLTVYAVVETTDGVAYVGGFALAFGDVTMSVWQPMSLESRSLKPVVFRVPPKFRPGAAASEAVKAIASGRIHTNLTQVGNVGAGEDDLMSFTLPANSLDAANKGVRVTAWGTFANNANTKKIKLYFGTAFYDVAAAAHQQDDWIAVFELYRVSQSVQRGCNRVLYGQAAALDADGAVQALATTADLATDVVIKVTGESVSVPATDDVLQKGMVVEVIG